MIVKLEDFLLIERSTSNAILEAQYEKLTNSIRFEVYHLPYEWVI